MTAITSTASRAADHETQTVQKNAAYVGSEQCLKCHRKAGEVWQNSKHSHAFTALVQAKNPGLRSSTANASNVTRSASNIQPGIMIPRRDRPLYNTNNTTKSLKTLAARAVMVLAVSMC